MKQTIYLHIGAPKTGTSAIQSFMNYNRKRLAHDHYCLYPNFNSPFFDRGKQHNHCQVFNNFEPSITIKKIERMISYSQKRKFNKIVLSCEGLFDNPEKANIVFEALSGFNNVSSIIVVYLRRQDHWLESAWKQWGIKNEQLKNIDHFIQKRHINWLDSLNKWAEIFGKDNIIVRPYEKEQLNNGLIGDFLNALDINFCNYDWIEPPKNNLTENFGFNRDIIELLNLNKGFYSDIHDNRLFNFFSQYLGENFKKHPFDNYSILSPVQRLALLEKYESMNKTIAKTYMGRMDGRLFYEPWPDPDEPWEPYEGLTIEKVVPIFTQMLYNMDKHYQKQFNQLRRNAQKEKIIWKKLDLFLGVKKRWKKTKQIMTCISGFFECKLKNG